LNRRNWWNSFYLQWKWKFWWKKINFK